MNRWAILLPLLLLPPSLLPHPLSRSPFSGSGADAAASNGRRTKTTFRPTSTGKVRTSARSVPSEGKIA